MTIQITRRALVAGTTAVTASAVIAGRVGAQGATPESDGWSLTDGRGVMVSADATPGNIIAQTISGASLWDFGIRVKGIFGDSLLPDGSNDPQAGDIDFGTVEVLGDWGSGLNLEQVIAVGADLFVDVGRAEDGSLWSIAPDVEAQLLAICPTFSVKTYQASVITTIAAFEELAVSLGADAEAPDLVAARSAYSEREAGFEAAVAANPGLKVLILTGDPASNALFVSPSAGDIGLWMLERGLEIWEPENPSAEHLNIFEAASWEELGKYPADVILYDSRTDPAAFADDPMWLAMPAVQAGQVGVWYSTFPYSYQKLNPVIDEMIATISSATVVT